MAQLITVTGYAMVLSSASDLAASAAVIAAMIIQILLAGGRWIGGILADRWNPTGVLLIACLPIALGIAGFGWGPPVMAIFGAASTGLGAGLAQVAALTTLMRYARPGGEADRMSALWNIAFDAGLGLGALLAGLLVI